MARILILDSDPTGLACPKPGRLGEADDLRAWLLGRLGGSMIVVPEFVDYEVRRSLLLSGAQESVGRLDALYASGQAHPLPISTAAMRRAAALWADVRREHRPTAGDRAIDGDAILSAQALEVCSDADDWAVLTENVRHIARYVGDRVRSRREVVNEWLRSPRSLI